MLDLTVFCDESETAGQMLSIAGYLGPAREWEALEPKWREALRTYKITEYHAHHCDKGIGEFAGRSIAERAAISRDFINLIDSVQINAVAVMLDTQDWKSTLGPFWKERDIPLDDSYFTGFTLFVKLVSDALDDLTGEERVAFVFDRSHFAGRAKLMYSRLGELAKAQSEYDFAKRLGSLAFDDSERYPGLQAADLLAYEARAHHMASGRERWQWQALIRRGRYAFKEVDREANARFHALIQTVLSSRNAEAWKV